MWLLRPFYFYLRENFECNKHSQVKINQQNKIKQKLNHKGNIFYARKNLKVVCYAFWCFFYAQNFFVKKINRLDNLIILYY